MKDFKTHCNLGDIWEISFHHVAMSGSLGLKWKHKFRKDLLPVTTIHMFTIIQCEKHSNNGCSTTGLSYQLIHFIIIATEQWILLKFEPRIKSELQQTTCTNPLIDL